MERHPKPANLRLVPHNFSYPRQPYTRHHEADLGNGSTPLSPLSQSNPLSGGGAAAPSPERLASARSAGSTPSLIYDDRPESEISEIYDDECHYRTVPWDSFWPPGPSPRRLHDQEGLATGSDKLHDFHFNCSPERSEAASVSPASPLYHTRDQLHHSPGSRTLSDCPIRPSTQPLPRTLPGPYTPSSTPAPFCRPGLETSGTSYTLFPKRIPLPPRASSLANLYQARAPQPQPLVLPRRPSDLSLLPPPTLRHLRSDLQLPPAPAFRRNPSEFPLLPPVLRHRQSDMQLLPPATLQRRPPDLPPPPVLRHRQSDLQLLPPQPALQRRPSDLPPPPPVLRHRQSDLELPPPPVLRRRPSELHMPPPPPPPLPHYQQHLQLTAAAAAAAAAAVAAAATAARERASPPPLLQSAFDSDSDDSDGPDTTRGLARLVRGLQRRSASESRRQQQQQQQQRTRAGTLSASAASVSTGPSPSPAPSQQDEGPRKRQGIDMFGRLLGRHSR